MSTVSDNSNVHDQRRAADHESFLSHRKMRVDDQKENIRTFDAENMEIAISKFFVFYKSFYGSAPLESMKVEEVANA